MSSNKNQKNLWGGRFTQETEKGFTDFNSSFRFDRRLFKAEIQASKAYAQNLFEVGLFSESEHNSVQEGLSEIYTELQQKIETLPSDSAEDIHSWIEAQLIAKIGDIGRKLHTGRSRNDQVATAFRIWMREVIDLSVETILHLQTEILRLAQKHRDAVIPGYTHLQRAQPILFAHWCLAYFEMLRRDVERFEDVHKRVNCLPLGSGALAGNSYPIDRDILAKRLGFNSVSRNSVDAVSDRDFCIEFAAATSLVFVHLSRLSEDIILYSTHEFGFLELEDKIATGSSLMPQKKNPDALELIRGKSGRIFGHLIGLLTVMKGLPLAYNKDLQEDKEAIFDSVDTLISSLSIMITVMTNLKIHKERMVEAVTRGYLNATEFADYLVRKGVPFRKAHETTGRAVLFAIEKGCELSYLSLEELQRFDSKITEDIFTALSIESAINSKDCPGGTAQKQVSEALNEAQVFLQKMNREKNFRYKKSVCENRTEKSPEPSLST